MTAPAADSLLTEIAGYVAQKPIQSEAALEAASWSLADSLGCAMLALKFPECRQRLGPVVEGAVMSAGSRVPGTAFELDPVQAAFNIGSMIRWLDYNDTWLAAEWGHPSDNLGGLLAVSDWLSRRQNGGRPPRRVTVRQLLEAQIKAYEIQGVLALENSFNRVGLDHVILVKVATAATATWILGGDARRIADVVSNAWIDTGPLRTYRHEPNTGFRKSWAAGDATARGVRVSMGHSNATAAETGAAIAAGAVSATHTFNAMRALDHQEPGILGVVLADDALYAELICDGLHSTPEMAKLWWRAKGPERGILVTDAMSAAGMPDGEYKLGGFAVQVSEGRAMARGVLAGSVLTLDRALENFVAFTGATVDETLRLVTTNPETMTGMSDRVGAIAVGEPANFVAVDTKGKLVASMVNGKVVVSVTAA